MALPRLRSLHGDLVVVETICSPGSRLLERMVENLTPYTDAHILAYPVEYIAGIDLYNSGEFHAAHDAWEERWMGEVGAQEKLFLQAMIQSAVAFHHL